MILRHRPVTVSAALAALVLSVTPALAGTAGAAESPLPDAGAADTRAPPRTLTTPLPSWSRTSTARTRASPRASRSRSPVASAPRPPTASRPSRASPRRSPSSWSPPTARCSPPRTSSPATTAPSTPRSPAAPPGRWPARTTRPRSPYAPRTRRTRSCAPPTRAPRPSSLAGADDLQLENSFVSEVGWVKPGDDYVSRIFVRNPADSAVEDVTVTLTAPRGTSITGARSAAGSVSGAPGSTVTWTIPSVPAGSADEPSQTQLIVESAARTTAQEPTIVWRDLSTTAVLARRRRAAGHRHQPRPARHPAGRAVRHRPVRRPPVPGGARGLLRPRLPDLEHRRRAQRQDQLPRPPGLDVQPLPGDEPGPAVPRGHGPLGRHRHRTVLGRRALHRPRAVGHLQGRDLRREPRGRTRLTALHRAHPGRHLPAARADGVLRLGQDRQRRGRVVDRRGRAGRHRLRRAARPASWSTTPPRSPTRRSTTPTSTPTRTASSTSSWSSSPAAAATAPRSSASRAAPTPTPPTTTSGRTRPRWSSPTPTPRPVRAASSPTTSCVTTRTGRCSTRAPRARR